MCKHTCQFSIHSLSCTYTATAKHIPTPIPTHYTKLTVCSTTMGMRGMWLLGDWWRVRTAERTWHPSRRGCYRQTDRRLVTRKTYTSARPVITRVSSTCSWIDYSWPTNLNPLPQCFILPTLAIPAGRHCTQGCPFPFHRKLSQRCSKHKNYSIVTHTRKLTKLNLRLKHNCHSS